MNWGTPHFDKMHGTHDKTVVENLPLSSHTTYETSYHNLKLAPQKNLKPRD